MPKERAGVDKGEIGVVAVELQSFLIKRPGFGEFSKALVAGGNVQIRGGEGGVVLRRLPESPHGGAEVIASDAGKARVEGLPRFFVVACRKKRACAEDEQECDLYSFKHRTKKRRSAHKPDSVTSCDAGSHSTDAIYPARQGRHAFPELPPRTLYDLAPNGACLCPVRCRSRRWSLTPPFHPYRLPGGNFLWRYPSACGVPRFPAAFRMQESGLSSPQKKGDCRTNLQKSKVKKNGLGRFFYCSSFSAR